jgi:cell division protein FtsW
MNTATLQVPATDWTLAGTVLALAGLGAIMVASASVGIANEDFGEPAHYFIQHLQALIIGLAAMWMATVTPVDWWNRGASLLLVLALAVLAVVFVPGVAEEINGSRRWVNFGPIGFQASEIARPLLLIYLASYAVRRHAALRSSMSGFAWPMALIGIAAVLLLLEPDYGATVVLLVTSLGVLFIAGARLRDLAITACAATGALAMLIYNDATRLDRLLFWLDPWQAPMREGYQLVNSLIAIGSGGWLGAGLGQGVQKLLYLPDAHTDFIFAVLAEELGMIGSTGVIVLFGLLVWKAFSLGRQACGRGLAFHGILATGIGITLGLQAVISIGVNTGLLPTKGLTLPLISFGRTSAIMTLFMLGILFRISRELRVPGDLLQAGRSA